MTRLGVVNGDLDEAVAESAGGAELGNRGVAERDKARPGGSRRRWPVKDDLPLLLGEAAPQPGAQTGVQLADPGLNQSLIAAGQGCPLLRSKVILLECG